MMWEESILHGIEGRGSVEVVVRGLTDPSCDINLQVIAYGDRYWLDKYY